MLENYLGNDLFFNSFRPSRISTWSWVLFILMYWWESSLLFFTSGYVVPSIQTMAAVDYDTMF